MFQPTTSDEPGVAQTLLDIGNPEVKLKFFPFCKLEIRN